MLDHPTLPQVVGTDGERCLLDDYDSLEAFYRFVMRPVETMDTRNPKSGLGMEDPLASITELVPCEVIYQGARDASTHLGSPFRLPQTIFAQGSCHHIHASSTSSGATFMGNSYHHMARVRTTQLY